MWKAYAELGAGPTEDKALKKHVSVEAETEETEETEQEQNEPTEEEQEQEEIEQHAESPVDVLAKLHSGLPGFYSATPTAKRTSTSPSSHYCTGLAAAGKAAYSQSDLVFVYNTGDAGNLENELKQLVEAGAVNAHGRVPMVEVIETRTGAGTIAAGANAVEARVSVIVSSQSLPLMLPSMMQISAKRAPCVFHVAAQKVGNNLAIAADVGGVITVRDTGFSIVASYTIQEAADMAHITHMAAIASGSPMLHVFNGVAVARASTHIRDSAPQTSTGLATFSTSPLEAIETVMDKLAAPLGRKYKFFEYYGAADATQVVVIFGVGASVATEMVRSLNAGTESALRTGSGTAGGSRVGVVVVRVYRPWNTAAFTEALPSTAGRICVATVSSNADATGALLADVISSIHSNSSTSKFATEPVVLSARIMPGKHGGSNQKIAEMFRNLNTPHPIKALQITDASAANAVVPSALPRAATQRTISIWGTTQVEGVLKHVHSMMTSEGLHAYTQVDKDTYHPLVPVRALATYSSDVISTGPSSACCDVVVVNDVRILSSHGVEIVRALDPSITSILAVNLDGEGGAGAPVNVSECLSLLLAQVPRQVKVIAFSPSKVHAKGVAIDGVTAATIVSLFQAQAPQLKISLPRVTEHIFAAGAADHATIHTFLTGLQNTIKDMTIDLHELDQDPENLDVSTITLGDVEDDGFVTRIATSPVPKSIEASNKRRASKVNLFETHKVAWNMLFNNDMDCTEAFRPYEEQTVYQVKLTKNQRLTPAVYDRNIFHLEFDTTGTDLKYSIGESLGVYGHNDAQDVEDFLLFYGLNGDDFVAVEGTEGREELLTVRQIFTQRLDLFGKPSQDFYAALVDHTTSTYQQKRLKWLGSDDKEGFKLRQNESYTFADILYEFKTAHPPLTMLIELIPPIKARHYSISSSIKMHPNSVHLLVVEVDWQSPGKLQTSQGRTRHGQCTRYLAGLKPGASVCVDIMTSVMNLPADPAAPVIGAALGTGLAPFMAFVQERTVLKQQGVKIGPMVLYFGARYRAEEFLYSEELEKAEKEGVLELRLAFSRDQKEKVYIQHLIVEDREKLGGYLLNDQGSFYLCGPTWPVPDVRKALCEGISTGAKTLDDADKYIDELKSEGRYVLEVY